MYSKSAQVDMCNSVDSIYNEYGLIVTRPHTRNSTIEMET